MSKKLSRPAAGRALFYSRDSGGQHEMTPGKYVEWAAAKARALGLKFNGTPEVIRSLIERGQCRRGDVFFDNCVSGNVLKRDGLDSLFAEIERDAGISHVFIPRRDRLARPDRPAEGVELEHRLRTAGITLVFQERSLPPLKRGVRENIGDQITALVEYDASGKFRDDHSERMIWAKLALAQKGHSTGGRPPFGYRRFLVDEAGNEVRQLVDGEKVRQAGHHVEWRPGPPEEIGLILRIASMLETMPALRVAKVLTAEGIPAPDAGRTRHDNGIPHQVRGVWHQTTITNIARNPLSRAIVIFGRRAMGDRRRMTPSGPRPVEEEDRRADGQPKVCQVPVEERISAPAAFEPLFPKEQADRLDAILDKRAGSQRGKPRSRDPEKNPLGARIFDMACRWPMYRAADGDRYFYRCGLYQQSDGAECRHNRIPGAQAAQVGLAAIRQQFLDPEARSALKAKLEAKLASLAAVEPSHVLELRKVTSDLASAEEKLAVIERNMAEATNAKQLAAMQRVFDERSAELERLREKKDALSAMSVAPRDHELAVQRAMDLLNNLPDLIEQAENQGAVKRLFDLVDLRMYLSFEQVKKTKRTLNQLAGGIITIGSAPAPIQPYSGPTTRGSIEKASEMVSEAVPSVDEEESLRNVSRGDRI
ncbi:recombinase family protein [Planctomyces sp. SH-PL14]|uniref:recombinase family protein n=1 Tax=Planctomyces sp. SH-PL14 TaxID=1632864 RepID=UPI0012E77D49|nr:recombinase family protein [Planctomyces sp. SH-PL14]